MFSRAASVSTKIKQQKLDRLRPPSPWTNDLADDGVAFFLWKQIIDIKTTCYRNLE
jgi:hypothetical protein